MCVFGMKVCESEAVSVIGVWVGLEETTPGGCGGQWAVRKCVLSRAEKREGELCCPVILACNAYTHPPTHFTHLHPLLAQTRSVARVAAFPIGIDPERFGQALETEEVQMNIAKLLNRYAGRKVRRTGGDGGATG